MWQILIGELDHDLFDVVGDLLPMMLVLTGLVPEAGKIRQHAQQFDVPLYEFRRERDLDVWRR